MRIAYIPLDNRPVNVYNVVKLGEAAGHVVITPPNLGGVPFDGNPTAQRFMSPVEVTNWLKSQTYDAAIISVDAITWGGLIPSRLHLDELSVTVNQAKTRINEVINAVGNKKLYFLDTVLRLASTIEVNGLTRVNYNSSRNYLLQPRTTAPVSVLESSATTPATITAYHSQTSATMPSGLSTYISKHYEKRTAKLEVSKYIIEQSASRSNIFTVVGVDDSSAEGVQINEIRYLKALSHKTFGTNTSSYSSSSTASYDPGYGKGQNKNRWLIMADADGLGMTLLARATVDASSVKPAVLNRRFGTPTVNIYEFESFEFNARLHIEATGASIATSAGVNTAELLSLHSSSQMSALITQMNTNTATNHKPTAICNTAEIKALPETFFGTNGDGNTQNYNASRLIAYSSWNTSGNHLGISLGHLVARTAYMLNNSGTNAAATASTQLLLREFFKDFLYIQVLRGSDSDTTTATLRGYVYTLCSNKDTNWNFENAVAPLTSSQQTQVRSRLVNVLSPKLTTARNFWDGRGVVKDYANGSFTLGHISMTETQRASTVQSVAFPWKRLFEIDLSPQLTVS